MCYTTEYASCYNKKPFLLNYVQNEIDAYVTRKITSCINELDNVVKNKGYTMQKGNLDIKTSINPYSASININYPSYGREFNNDCSN